MVVAGSDTISGTLTWMIAILLHYPDVQQRICDEIDTFIKDHKRLPSFADRDAFPYMIAVQKECMRYRPVTQLAFIHVVEKRGTFERKVALAKVSLQLFLSVFSSCSRRLRTTKRNNRFTE